MHRARQLHGAKEIKAEVCTWLSVLLRSIPDFRSDAASPRLVAGGSLHTKVSPAPHFTGLSLGYWQSHVDRHLAGLLGWGPIAERLL